MLFGRKRAALGMIRGGVCAVLVCMVAGAEFNRCRTRFTLTNHHIVSLLDQCKSTRSVLPLLC